MVLQGRQALDVCDIASTEYPDNFRYVTYFNGKIKKYINTDLPNILYVCTFIYSFILYMTFTVLCLA